VLSRADYPALRAAMMMTSANPKRVTMNLRNIIFSFIRRHGLLT
jgi:hypothetical protein